MDRIDQFVSELDELLKKYGFKMMATNDGSVMLLTEDGCHEGVWYSEVSPEGGFHR